MIVMDILCRKSPYTKTISAGSTLAHAVQLMMAAGIGALVVQESDGSLVGMLSERDVIGAAARALAGRPDRLVREAMSPVTLTVAPGDPVLSVMRVMTEQRLRHVPVLSDGRLIGIISVGDVLKSRLEEKAQEVEVLQDIVRWPRAA